MKFPDDTKVGDMFWMNNEPVRVIAWGYISRLSSFIIPRNNIYGPSFDSYFDIEFVDIVDEGRPAATMVVIPVCWDFYETEIRRMSSLEKELF